jgi:catechol 2,3-dioxygenase-like lactoylglutathione lyase family enzyme
MTLEKTTPLSALCILCHDADKELPFYRDTMGMAPTRAEESFYSLQGPADKTTFCLWEIGHIARNSVFTDHPEDAIPNKYMLTARMSSAASFDALRAKVAKTGAQFLEGKPDSGDGREFSFIDACGIIWQICQSADALPEDGLISLDRITLLCQDLATARSFYEAKLSCEVERETETYVAYHNGGRTQLALWSAEDARATFNLPNQTAIWKAHTGMIALSYPTFDRMNAEYETLRDRNVKFDEKPASFQWDFDASYFCDPDNNIWELFAVPKNIEDRMLPLAEKE